MFCLARTQETDRPQTGISFLLLDMDSPGVEVRPVQTIDEGYSICEVFFNDVQIPKENLVGEEGKGWTYAKFLLGHERAMIARVGRSRMQLQRAYKLATHTDASGERHIDKHLYRTRLRQIETRLRSIAIPELRMPYTYRPNYFLHYPLSTLLPIRVSS